MLRESIIRWGRRPRLPQMAERQPGKADLEVCPTAQMRFPPPTWLTRWGTPVSIPSSPLLDDSLRHHASPRHAWGRATRTMTTAREPGERTEGEPEGRHGHRRAATSCPSPSASRRRSCPCHQLPRGAPSSLNGTQDTFLPNPPSGGGEMSRERSLTPDHERSVERHQSAEAGRAIHLKLALCGPPVEH